MDGLFDGPEYVLEIDGIDSDSFSVGFSEDPFASSPLPDQERGDSGDEDDLQDLFGDIDADADNSLPHSPQSSRHRASSQDDSDSELFVRQVNVLQDHFSEILERETRAGEERIARAAAARRAAANRRAEEESAAIRQRAERAVERAAELGSRGPIVILHSLPRGQQDFRRPAQANRVPQQPNPPRLDPTEFAARLARRHHPYRMPSPHPSQQSREQHQHEPQYPYAPDLPSSDEDDEEDEDDFEFEVLDELIEMEFNRMGDNLNSLPPRPSSRRVAVGGAGAGAAAGAARAGAGARRRAGSSLRAEVSVIDLTEEPDSPEDLEVLPNTNRAQASFPPQPHRNPRRQMSFGNRTPSLTRSDGSLLGAAPSQVIDLTIDDDAAPGPPPAPVWGAAANRPRAPPPLTFPRRPTAVEEAEQEMGALFGMMRRFSGGMHNIPGIGGIGFLHRLGGALGHQPQEVDVQFLGNNHAHNHDNPLGNNLPNFNYRANGYNNPGSPKPAHVPPPPAREGFSRGTGEELAFVCPSCEDELAYDPDEENKHPAKKARTKKDREEHHFWAVKECGHVYCRACYENRKTKTKTTFRAVESQPRKLLCAVEDCNSDVSAKAAWVGLFL